MRKLLIPITVASLLTGCAVSQKDVNAKYSNVDYDVMSLSKEQRAKQALQQSPLVMVNAPFLSTRTMSLAKEVRMPASFNNSSSFVRPRNGVGFSLPEVADLITKRYGVRVRVRPDVFLPASSLVPGSGSGSSSASGELVKPSSSSAGANQSQGTVSVNGGLPAPLSGAGSSNAAARSLSGPSGGAGLGEYGQTIDFDFTGSLSDYLQRISAVMGINAEWDEGAQELQFYRLVTKSYTLDTTPVASQTKSLVTKDSLSSGSMQSTGSTGSAQLAIDADTWASVEKALNTFKTKSGAVVMNRGTRSITVIDTKDVVDMADRYIKQQNDVLSRQAMLSVKMITVRMNRDTAAGFNLNLALRNFVGSTTNPAWTLGVTGVALDTTGGGGMNYSVVDTSRSAVGSAVVAKFINSLGNVVDEYSQDVPVRNNRTVPVLDYGSQAYVSRTTSASGGLSGSSVPGIETSTVTSGTMLFLTPSIKSNESLVLNVGLDRSSEPTFTQSGAGSGATQQYVQLPRQTGIKIDTEVGLKNNETLILMGLGKEISSGTKSWGINGVANGVGSSREVQFLIITPRIISGA